MEKKQNFLILNNDQKIPLCGYGTFLLENPEENVYLAIKNGARLIDTAQKYGNEKEVGAAISRALKEGLVSRNEIFVITKIWMESYHDVENTLKKQLSDLQLDYVDMYLLHWPYRCFDQEKKQFQKLPLYKIWGMMEKTVTDGLTKSIGVSNFNVSLIMDMLTYCNIKPVVNEIEVHPYYTRKELVKFCKSQKINIIAYGSTMKGSYFQIKQQQEDKYDLTKEKVVVDLAKKYGKSEVAIVLIWAISQDMIVIPKSQNEKRIKENLEIVDTRLSPEEIEMLDSLNINKRFCDRIGSWKEYGEVDIFA